MTEQKANARLIAAAPELLSACYSALEYLNDLQSELDPESSTAGRWKDIRDAISKAEGNV